MASGSALQIIHDIFKNILQLFAGCGTITYSIFISCIITYIHIPLVKAELGLPANHVLGAQPTGQQDHNYFVSDRMGCDTVQQ